MRAVLDMNVGGVIASRCSAVKCVRKWLIPGGPRIPIRLPMTPCLSGPFSLSPHSHPILQSFKQSQIQTNKHSTIFNHLHFSTFLLPLNHSALRPISTHVSGTGLPLGCCLIIASFGPSARRHLLQQRQHLPVLSISAHVSHHLT